MQRQYRCHYWDRRDDGRDYSGAARWFRKDDVERHRSDAELTGRCPAGSVTFSYRRNLVIGTAQLKRPAANPKLGIQTAALLRGQ